jgi:hypothetical protein
MTNGICAGVISVRDDRGCQRAALGAVAFPSYPMQFVIAVADRLRWQWRIGVGSRRSLLQEIAVCVVRVRDCPRLRIGGREQQGERIVSKRTGAPLRAV